MRIDKFIWFVRLTKTRKEASEAISKGRFLLNLLAIKPSKEIKLGDFISVKKNNALFTYKVLQIPERRIGPKLVCEFLEDNTSDTEKHKFQEYQKAQKEYMQFGEGKPTKKQRRELMLFKQ
jgi:ribosome-associated heat shock protein Hsp15